VRLVVDESQGRRDRYGRLLRYAELGGRDLGQAQLRAGHAEAYIHGGEAFRRLRGYRRATQRARRAGRGMWGSCGSAAGGSP
jgi:micrococcal nuclease